MIESLIKIIKQFSPKKNVNFNKNQWWSVDKFEAFQNQRLRKVQ